MIPLLSSLNRHNLNLVLGIAATLTSCTFASYVFLLLHSMHWSLIQGNDILLLTNFWIDKNYAELCQKVCKTIVNAVNVKLLMVRKSSASDEKCDSTTTTLKRYLCSSEVLKRRTSLYNWARVRNFNVSVLCGVYLDSSIILY